LVVKKRPRGEYRGAVVASDLSEASVSAPAMAATLFPPSLLTLFHAFDRYLHMTSFSLVGAMGTPAVLAAVGAVVSAQLTFTYAPFMHRLFEAAPVSFADGVLIVAVGVMAMIVLKSRRRL
jgi:magnesium-transporting ATPase (P-type)